MLLQFVEYPQSCWELIPWRVLSQQSSNSLWSNLFRIQTMMDTKMISCSSRWEQQLSANMIMIISNLHKNITCDVKVMQILTPFSFLKYFSCCWSPSQLNRRAQVSQAVQVISLKPGSLNQISQCITAGWGDIGDNNTLPKTLQEVNVTTLPQMICKRRWGQVPITQSMVCGVGSHSLQGFCSVRD